MSRVFLAEETSLRRKIVVKVVSPELAEGVSVQRFQREIAVAAGLQNPHIVPLLSAGDAAGLPYYTMPFVEGQSLREHLGSHAPLGIGPTVSILRDVARALAYAHDRGIIHRDIKPGNILLTGDSAVVLDFGISKALTAAKTADSSTLTQAGAFVGTPAYIAPEQAVGDPGSDYRADIYSLGCVAYEMLSGKTPFGSRSVHDLISAHVSELPQAIRVHRPDCPPAIATLVMRCLEKNPALRPQSAREVLTALSETAGGSFFLRGKFRKPAAMALAGIALALVGFATFRMYLGSSGSAGSPATPVAVLPFTNASGDTASDYFAEGMTDELATALAKMPGLRVASRTSSYRFRADTSLDAIQIAKKLDVDAIIEGSVRRAGSQLRITAQLTRGSDGQSLWADAFDAEDKEILAVQSRLTEAIVRAVSATLSGRPRAATVASVTAPGTNDRVAYDSYLRGLHALNQGGAGIPRAILLFHKAIERDSTFAKAWGGLARAWSRRSDFDASLSPTIALDSTRIAAKRAIALDSRLSEPYLALGHAYSRAGDLNRARENFSLASTLDPQAASEGQYNLYMTTARFDSAEALAQYWITINPSAGDVTAEVARLVARDPARRDEARLLARRAVELDPTTAGVVIGAAGALLNTQNYDESLNLLRTAISQGLMSPRSGVTIRMADLAALGHSDSVRSILRDLQRAPRTPRIFISIATAAALLGRWDTAFAAADTVVIQTKRLDFMQWIAPAWHPVAGDQRLRALCSRTPLDCAQLIKVLEAAAPLPGQGKQN